MTKGKISKFFVPYLPVLRVGRKMRVPMWRIIKAILYKLKTGIQWRYLPMRQFFGFTKYSWESVYYHFNKWSQMGIWQKCYAKLLQDYRRKLDMSVINLDGTHSPAKRGGQHVGYQGRKKQKTTNMLIITDKQGVPVGWSKPISGEHNDAFELAKTASEIFEEMESNSLSCDGLFLNADAGFDTVDFRLLCEQMNIFHNIDRNKRNRKSKTSENDYLFDKEYIKKDLQSNNLTLGLMVSDPCELDMKPYPKTGWLCIV